MDGSMNHEGTQMNQTMGTNRKKMMMHMSFYWGNKWMGHCSIVRADSNNVAAGVIRSIVHTVRVGVFFAFGSQVTMKTNTLPDLGC
ncbi:hypothetical protein MKX01_016345 [Papaver californicum]|nr:hypothetical protein MKX01_016345 [Papaver californicum]